MDIIVANIEPENLKNLGTWYSNSYADTYGWHAVGPSEGATASGSGNLLEAYDYCRALRSDVIGFVHDDVIISKLQIKACQEWDIQVLREFGDPKVGVVGFGGALRLGHRDLYKVPYRLPLLAREDYRSNTDDWADHGHQCTEPMDVAVIDGFAMFVRRELLDKMGGWQPEKWPPHHCYDLRLCCEARRHGYRVRIVPVRCRHLGGGTSVKHSEKVKEIFKAAGYESDQDAHEKGHRMIYEEYADVLPIREL